MSLRHGSDVPFVNKSISITVTRLVFRAATVNRNIGYPLFRTHGSVSVCLFQISVRFRFVFFFTVNIVKTDILTGKSYKI